MKFVGLHAHTTFSIGDAIGYPKDHFEFALENGMDAMAITDHGSANSFGYITQEAEKFKSKGVPFKSIFGVETYIHPNLDDWKQLKEQKDLGYEEAVLFIENETESKGKHYDPIKRRHHLVVLAQNDIGLKNLYKLISKSYQEGNYYRFPRMDFNMLEQHNEGLLISSACLAGLGSWIVLREHENGSESVQSALERELLPLFDIFGKDRAFLELQFNRLPEQRIVNDELIKFSKTSGYKLISTVDSHYARPEWWRDRELYKILAWQSKGMKFEKDDLPKKIEELKCELYPKNGKQLFQMYKDVYGEDCNPELDEIVKNSIEFTYDIAHDLIEKIDPDGKIKLPTPNISITPFQRLKDLCLKGMQERNLDENEEYIDRLITELKVIKSKDFALYFTTLYDALEALREHLIIGPARGSGGGSLVCYLLNITQLDPIKNELLFERFLSEYREEAPDIDTDIEDKTICLKALKDRFGDKGVVSVSNFNTLQLKSLVKDISKFYEIPFMEVNDVTTKMEEEARPKILESVGGDQKLYVFNLEGAKEHSPTFQEFLKKYPLVAEHIEILFGQIKSIGRHAGGVLLCDDFEECMPAIRIRGVDQSPWTEGMAARHLERFGLIKYDFLGLTTLRFIRRCIELILKSQGNENPSMKDVYDFYNKNLHPDTINPEDQKVFKNIYHEGKFPGIFQFTERGAQNFCRRAKPKSVDDIAVITSIFRPGPLEGKVDRLYVDVVHGNKDMKYDHPVLEEVLGSSHGFIVFQEQFMQLANKLADFSLEESDKLRKLLVKPVTSMSDDLIKKRVEAGEKFIKGCIDKGLTKERAEHLWEKEILGFVSYGFNRAHAVAYAYISYQCAWLMTYYEKEWIRAYLELDPDRDKAIADVTSVGYTVSKPNILKSTQYWEAEGNVLIPSLTTIKGVGDKAVKELIEIRKQGPFKDLYDFFYVTEEKKFKNGNVRIKRNWKFSKFNKTALSAMIKLEGFDDFDIVGPGKMFENYKHMHDVIIENFEKVKRGTVNFMDAAELVPSTDGWNNEEKIEIQTDLLGTYDRELILTQGTLDFFREHDILPLSDVDELARYIWFVVQDIKKAKTKNGKPFFKLTISDSFNVTKKLNYFGPEPDGGFKKNNGYVSILCTSGKWINVPYGEKIIKAS